MKRLSLAVLIFVCSSCASQNEINSYSTFLKNLYALEKNEIGKKYASRSFERRNKFVCNCEFINYESDTVFLLEGFSVQDGLYYNVIWTCKGRVEYIDKGKTIEVSSMLYSDRILKLIEEWDIKTIRGEEKEHGTAGGLLIVAYRIIILNGKASYESIVFNEFIDMRKDRNIELIIDK